TSTLGEILDEADVLLLLVGHTPLRNLDPVVAAQLTAARIAVDCVNAWPRQTWEYNGFHLTRLGDHKAG
nr:UDP-N-acetyl-D-mannosamine dehydrogenase [Anaerolinea sp.]